MTKRILVMNLTRMGDLVQSTPLIAGLRKKYPDAGITLMVSSNFEAFAPRIPYIDEILVFNLRQFNEKNDRGELKSWVEFYQYLKTFLDGVKQRHFDTVFNLSHSKLSAFMLSYLKISKVCGFIINDTGDWMTVHPWLQYFGIEPFNRIFNPFNLVDIYLHAGEVENSIDRVILKADSSDEDSIKSILDKFKIRDDEVLIGFQAGSSLKGRRWSAESFTRLGDLLCCRMNAKIVIFGVDSEAELADEIAQKMEMKHRVLNLAGKTTISQLMELLKRCNYLVSNDTGTMHLAAAVGTPIVGLFFAHANPIETGPYASGNVIFQARIACAPCSYGVTCNDVVCIKKVSPDDVYQFMFSHYTQGEWKAPSQLKNYEEMNIFVTGFGPDGLLEMKPLIRRSLDKDELFRLAYRSLWLDALDQRSFVLNEADERLRQLTQAVENWYKPFNSSQLLESMKLEFQALKYLHELSKKGLCLTNDIEREINTGCPRTEKLTALGEKIEELDEQIDKVGLTTPQVKPVSDLFSKRKENFCGDDIKLLAVETSQCYNRLFWESTRLDFVLKYFLENLYLPFHNLSQTHLAKSLSLK